MNPDASLTDFWKVAELKLKTKTVITTQEETEVTLAAEFAP